ncbi:M48 family metalloprotease [bacterium]|nr:M48 family metalloprotease [bacterium]
MKRYRIMGICASVTCVILFGLSCAVNPVTGKTELMLLSTADEIALGKQTDSEIVEMYGVYQDEPLQAYINTIGRKMTPVTHQPQLPYTFKVLDTDVVNAFAVPGGFVYLTRGILAYLNDEAELAGVIGHELGHVNARHSAKMLSQAQLAQLGLQIGSALSETFAQFSGLAGFGVQMLFLRFSRDNEREADDLGVEYSSKSGYDANGMAEFFKTLERMHPSEGGGLPDWFSTHPDPVNRITAVEQKTREWQNKLTGKTFLYNRKEYIRQIDGLVFGPDPRQGYVEDNVFYHPGMKFLFPVPAGWSVNNLPSQVQLISKQENGIILFTMTKENSLDAAADAFAKNTGASILSREHSTINGFKALRIESEITGEQNLRVRSVFIDMSGIMTFHGFSTPDAFSQYGSDFDQTMTGFRKLTDTRKINVRPVMLKIVTLSAPMTLSQVLAREKVDSEQYEAVAVMNALRLDEKLEKGKTVKIIIKG